MRFKKQNWPARKRADTFVGQIGNVLRAPVDNFRRLRSLSKFGQEGKATA